MATIITPPARIANDGVPGPAQPPGCGMPVTLDPADLLDRGVFGHAGEDPRARGFAMLRSQILRRLGRTSGHILAVTSTRPQDGKSFIATNLAVALAQIHATCLVDLDLRRPVVGNRLGLPPGPGVDDYLSGDAGLTSTACTIGRHSLTVMPVREARANSADLLSAPRTDLLFQRLRAMPGPMLCIIDTPPVLEGDDMMILARHVDAILLVVREGSTRQADLRESLRLLHPTPIAGTILNRTIRMQPGGDYGQYHGYRPL